MKAEIEITGPGKGNIRLDGHDVSKGVRGVTFAAGVGGPARLTLDLVIVERASVTGDVEVVIPAATREALIDLGWPPPPTGDLRRVTDGDPTTGNRRAETEGGSAT